MISTHIVVIIVFLSAFISVGSYGTAEAIITSSENFCSQFPTHPECTGWRVKPISDNFWFCEYVDLPSMCKHPPDRNKEITPLDSDYCCRIIDDNLTDLRDTSTLYHDPEFLEMTKKGLTLPKSYPVDELVIWTEKDHYHFGERINVYGKFNFGDPVIEKANNKVDIIFGGKKVIRNLPVRDNGWFGGFFYMHDPQTWTTGPNMIVVPYEHVPTLENPDTIATATYRFTTGNVPELQEPFLIKMNLNKFLSGVPIKFWTEPENPVPINLRNIMISRITNPDGVSFPLPKNPMNNVDRYLNDISSLPAGNYTISITVGNFTQHKGFEYVDKTIFNAD